MVAFSDILYAGYVEDHKMMKDKLIAGKQKLKAGLEVNETR